MKIVKKTDKRTTGRLLTAARELLTISGSATLPKDDAGALTRMAEVLSRMYARLERREKQSAARKSRLEAAK